MQTTFLQKVILTMIAAALAAGLVMFYRDVIEAGNNAVNKDWKTEMNAPRPHAR